MVHLDYVIEVTGLEEQAVGFDNEVTRVFLEYVTVDHLSRV